MILMMKNGVQCKGLRIGNHGEPKTTSSLFRIHVWHIYLHLSYFTLKIYQNQPNARWFKPWPFHPLVGGHSTMEKGHKKKTSQKGHKKLPGVGKYTMHGSFNKKKCNQESYQLPREYIAPWTFCNGRHIILRLVEEILHRPTWMKPFR